MKPGSAGSPRPKIYIEKRAGKSITVISGLHTYGSSRIEGIAKELKTKLGVGGTIKNGIIEIQGEKSEAVREWFEGQRLINR